VKLRVVIADDEPPALAKLKKGLLAIQGIEIVAEATDGKAASEAIRSLRPDIAILDIKMPRMDGLTIVRSLTDPPKIVFVTAYAVHGASAFECQAADYLLKPYTAVRLQSVISRLKEQLKLERLSQWIRGEVQVTSDPQDERRLVLKSGSEISIVAADDVECAIAEGNYLHVMTPARKYFVRGVLAGLDEMLAGMPFIRVHRSATVNTSKIQLISLADRELKTISGFRVPISRARLDSLIDVVKELGFPVIGIRNRE
jgi:two-component system LytT family response regulator